MRFWSRFFILRLRNGTLPIARGSGIGAAFEEIGEEDVSACCGLPGLNPDQEQCLEGFLESILKAVVSSGVTEHKIDIGQNAPIKQRCYLISPRDQKAILM